MKSKKIIPVIREILIWTGVVLYGQAIHPHALKYYLPLEEYEKTIWMATLSYIGHDMIFFILLADDLFKGRGEFLKRNKYIPFILYILICIILTVTTLPIFYK